MKKRLVLLLLGALMLFSFVSCSEERYDLLYSVEADSITFCVRGSGSRAKQIVLKSGEDIIWNEKIKVNSKVGSLGGTYGFELLDFNFDGHLDFMIADNISGDCVSYLCWLWDAEQNEYVPSEELTGLCNLKTDEELKAVFAFNHSYTEYEAYLDAPASYETTDSATKYVWREGKLIPAIQVSITYYSESGLYCYGVAHYDDELGKLGNSDDKWLTPEEYEAYDMSFLYYFK